MKLQVILNPFMELSELPLKNYYTYVLKPDLEFDSEGKWIGPNAVFNHLPIQRLFTLNLDVPNSWLVTPTIARYDLDNLRLRDIPEDRVVYAQFELQHLIIEGFSEQKILIALT